MNNVAVKPSASSPVREAFGLALLLSAGLLTRIAFVWTFPTQPVSDFRSVVYFGVLMRDSSITAGGKLWDLLSPGLPLVLSWIFRVFPDSPESVARFSTAVATGLLPALPYLLWRGVQPFWVRLLAGGLLAVWPGQILFSGVVAQDNWVLLPAVALAALAVRAFSAGRGYPLAAGLLYALGVSVRQEMLVVLVPLLVVAAGLWPRRERWPRRLLLCGLAAGLPLFLIAWQRQAATGRFALTSVHGGPAVLGSYIPGATANAWADPVPYIASVEPSLLEDREELGRRVMALTLREVRSRPFFHAARIAAFTLEFAVASESANLYWSLGPDAMPPARVARAAGLVRVASPLLKIEMAILLALFVAALLLSRRSPAVWVLAVAMALKIGLHALTVAQGRYFLTVTALQILGIALGAREAARRGSWRPVAAALAAGFVAAAAVFVFAPRAVAWVRARDVDVQRSYRFRLAVSSGEPKVFDCAIHRGRLTFVSPNGAKIETFHPNPLPGETAAAECVSSAAAPLPPLVIRLFDPYAPGGSPGRMVQRVAVDGREVLARDVSAEPGSGWSEIPLSPPAPGGKKTFVIELTAVQPDPGISWGREAATAFELAYPREDG